MGSNDHAKLIYVAGRSRVKPRVLFNPNDALHGRHRLRLAAWIPSWDGKLVAVRGLTEAGLRLAHVARA